MNLVLLMIGPYHIPGINNAACTGSSSTTSSGSGSPRRATCSSTTSCPRACANPIYSHKLSLIGFWSLAFFYPFVGIHHYLY